MQTRTKHYIKLNELREVIIKYGGRNGGAGASILSQYGSPGCRGYMNGLLFATNRPPSSVTDRITLAQIEGPEEDFYESLLQCVLGVERDDAVMQLLKLYVDKYGGTKLTWGTCTRLISPILNMMTHITRKRGTVLRDFLEILVNHVNGDLEAKLEKHLATKKKAANQVRKCTLLILTPTSFFVVLRTN